AHETPEQGLATRVGEVQRDRALAARVHLPPQLAAIAQPRAQRIAAPRVLDLDDVGAVVGQPRREHAARDESGAVDDANAAEGAAHDADYYTPPLRGGRRRVRRRSGSGPPARAAHPGRRRRRARTRGPRGATAAR